MNNVKYYWVKNKETGFVEICGEFTTFDGIAYYKVFDEEHSFLIKEFKKYYTFICEVSEPNEI